jgi:aerobic carbon-monoxide dehydrogenase small subunit
MHESIEFSEAVRRPSGPARPHYNKVTDALSLLFPGQSEKLTVKEPLDIEVWRLLSREGDHVGYLIENFAYSYLTRNPWLRSAWEPWLQGRSHTVPVSGRADYAGIGDRIRVSVRVNGADYVREVEPRDLLVYFLREKLGLTGTHVGCDTSQCGACTVLLDGRAVKSCTLFAVQADGHQLTTIEGLAGSDGTLHPLQEAFWQEHGLQCGFCTPGFIMTAAALLAANPQPSEAEVKRALAGNLCRCTGYVNIIKAVQAAAQHMSSLSTTWEKELAAILRQVRW